MIKGTVFMKRYGPPGLLDIAPYGSICQVDNECDRDIYVQVNNDEDTPKWMLMGTYPSNKNKLEIMEEAHTFKSLKF